MRRFEVNMGARLLRAALATLLSVVLTATASTASASAPNFDATRSPVCLAGWTGPQKLIAYGSTTELDVCWIDMTILRGAPRWYIVTNPGTTVWRLDDRIGNLAAVATTSPQTQALASALTPSTRPDHVIGPGDRVQITSGFADSGWSADPELTLGWYGIDLAADTIAEGIVETGVVLSTEALFRKSAWNRALQACAIGVYGALPDDGVDATDPAVAAFLDGAGSAVSGGVCASELWKARNAVKSRPLTWADDLPATLSKLGSRRDAVETVVEFVSRAIAAVR